MPTDAPVGKYDFQLYHGDNTTKYLVIGTADLTGQVAKMQVRAGDSDDSALVAELSTANGRITVGAAGAVTINMTEAQKVPGEFWYDLKVYPSGGAVRTFLAGRLCVRRRKTIP